MEWSHLWPPTKSLGTVLASKAAAWAQIASIASVSIHGSASRQVALLTHLLMFCRLDSSVAARARSTMTVFLDHMFWFGRFQPLAAHGFQTLGA